MMSDCGFQVLRTLRWERPRPRSFPPPWPLTLKPAPPPARGHTSPGLGLPGWLGQQPSPSVRCLRVLPACPHVGAHWPQVHVFGQQQRDQPLTSPFAASSSFSPPQEAGVRPDAEEVCLASHATSAVVPPPPPHPPKLLSDTHLQSQPLVIPAGSSPCHSLSCAQAGRRIPPLPT